MSNPYLEREQQVTPLELFFDLVFAFGFTQVTTVFSDNPTWSGLGHGLLILVALWWAWAAYAWLTNTVDPGEGAVWGAILVAMAAMFIASLAVPEAFGSHGVVFGIAFLIVNVMWLTLYALGAHGDRDLLGAILRNAPWALAGTALIVAAGFVHGGLRPLLWLAALIVGLFGPLLVGVSGWRVQPAHFVERHGLIVIIAIGESLIAIGLGARATALGTGVIVAAVLGLVVVTSFWLAYFDFFSMRGRQMLADQSGEQRIALARDVYTYLHLPMVAGIVLFAFAMKTTLAHVGDELDTIPAVGLCGGPALYLFAYVALRFRVSRTFGRGRLLAAVACGLLFPVAVVVPALVALALMAAVWVALHAYEFIWWREARARTRAPRVPASASETGGPA
ncbi:MAG TPA: low temperature requirement protein A [Gaiellaceae bacterium]|nr:low temperature requirement protein A [Gaiellaceae bacterium]